MLPKTDSNLFIAGLICVVLSAVLVVFTLYLAPYLIFSLRYKVPELIIWLESTFVDDLGYAVGFSRLIIGMIFLIPGIVLGICAYSINQKLKD